MQDAIVDPQFNEIRAIHPLCHWCEEFLGSNYLSLTDVEDRICTAISAYKAP